MFCAFSGTTAIAGSRLENCSIAFIDSQFVTIRNSTPSCALRFRIEALTNPGIFESCGNVSVRRCSTYSSACVDLASPRQWREIMLIAPFVATAGAPYIRTPLGSYGHMHWGPDRQPRVPRTLTLTALGEAKIRKVKDPETGKTTAVTIEHAAAGDIVAGLQKIFEAGAKGRGRSLRLSRGVSSSDFRSRVGRENPHHPPGQAVTRAERRRFMDQHSLVYPGLAGLFKDAANLLQR